MKYQIGSKDTCVTKFKYNLMKLALLSDVHGNITALEAVQDDAEPAIDGYIMLGDYIGLLGSPGEVVEFAMENSLHSVKGNHDISVVENQKGHVNSKKLSEFELSLANTQLTEDQVEWVHSIDSYEEVDELGFVMSHAYPNPTSSTGLEPGNVGLTKGNYTKAASEIDSDKYDFVFVGHTHSQSKLDCKKFGHDLKIVNPGSVGQPISDQTAQYAVVDFETQDISLNSVKYDSDKVISTLEEEDVPFNWWS